MQRRHLIGAASAWAAAWPLGGSADPLPFASPALPARIRASVDRVIDIGVCTRPFRLQGPRIESERLFGKTVVHHYGHGGSGWSLSWGSAAIGALPLIQATGERRIAVIGGGAIGLTTARVAQQAGLRVRLYARERPPEVASTHATGMWTPDSRLCALAAATPAFERRWEAMARHAFRSYQQLLGAPGSPIEWRDGHVLSDTPFDAPGAGDHGLPGEPEYPDLMDLIADLRPRSSPLRPDQHPFKVAHARRFTQMVFHIRPYQRMLVEDFLRDGGEWIQRDFQHARELATLPERTLVNCTGYGAKALFNDPLLIPVRGQTARLIPQPEVTDLLVYRGHNLVVVPRRDGLLVQAQDPQDFNNPDHKVVRALTDAAVQRLASLFA
ncbi:NAD(P)/FAD-dependent oxidoreductase [Roseateles amylovorans]|uniref:D-amino-acid oxidase n=1 Tax=Roseateles amylovorans TaxID=2978473 RepID=A0ABY6B8Y5_9BURK|nr:FAD-dependent oxidoreductase [Roseateles amylovorans]UXH80376.1 FAD-binding oxidoreductase [Roseateles amylovorans]